MSCERREVAVHREHGVGDDDRLAAAGTAQPARERVEVGVRVDDRLRAREAAAVDDRGVVERVGEDHLAAAGQRGDHAGVGEEARAEQHARLACP